MQSLVGAKSKSLTVRSCVWLLKQKPNPSLLLVIYKTRGDRGVRRMRTRSHLSNSKANEACMWTEICLVCFRLISNFADQPKFRKRNVYQCGGAVGGYLSAKKGTILVTSHLCTSNAYSDLNFVFTTGQNGPTAAKYSSIVGMLKVS